MFGSSVFRNDPFFNQNTDIMSEFDRMDQVMTDFRSSFGMPSMFPTIAGPTEGRMERFGQREMMPFGFGRSMFGDMFRNMDSMFSEMQNNPNAHCFTSSKVVSYSNDGSGEPKYYEATSETTQGPGGVRQTRKSERNSVTGMDRMAIGHHIYDRGHIVERSKNRKTNDREEKHDYLNMEEEEKDAFHREWQEKARPSSGRLIGGGYQQNHRPRRAIDSAEYHRNNQDNRPRPPVQRHRERDAHTDGRRVRIHSRPDEI